MGVGEFVELIVITRGGVASHASNFTAVLFAYLAMAYLVADKLSFAQLLGVSVLYSVYLFLPANAATADIQTLSSLIHSFHATHPLDAAIYSPFAKTFPYAFVMISIGSWLLSILYAVQRYRNRNGV